MTLHLILFLWLLFIIEEAIRNWYMIERLHKPINHTRQAVIRSIAALLYWLYVGIFTPYIELASWLVMPFMMFMTFWSGFDMLLNILRGKSIAYFGSGSRLDRLQSAWPEPWIFFKFLLSGALITLYYKLPDML